MVEANPVFAAPGDMEWAAADTVAVAVVTPEDVAKEEQEKADKEAAEREAAERAEREAVANRSYERQEPASVAVPTAHFSGILGVASQYLGTPYVFGGTSPAGFDCSGYVQYVYAQAGVQLPRTAAAQAMVGTQIPASQAQPGDLVYFPSGHIGIYAGNGQIMHAPYPGRSVELVPLWNEYYQFVRL
ncbi:NlpC/P60 family protein [Gleimia coleocanis DSM 15436]|uniref:NlpC/P60 family protein n=1 Tax=Gleimia coleocanis DSM 15436 TaxID=525245 RepID=C0VYL6_9ACTO|nr:NlpC/P60 family protein [Gleimia coleocanis DSM 15436]